MGAMLFFVVMMSWLVGCSKINKEVGLKDDNVIESSLENLIKSYTGLDLDLTPED